MTSVGRYGNKYGGKKYLILGLAVAGGILLTLPLEWFQLA
jgi:hypothetical protein